MGYPHKLNERRITISREFTIMQNGILYQSCLPYLVDNTDFANFFSGVRF